MIWISHYILEHQLSGLKQCFIKKLWIYVQISNINSLYYKDNKKLSKMKYDTSLNFVTGSIFEQQSFKFIEHFSTVDSLSSNDFHPL